MDLGVAVVLIETKTVVATVTVAVVESVVKVGESVVLVVVGSDEGLTAL